MLVQVGREAGVFPSGNDLTKWGDEESTVYYTAIRELGDRASEYKKQNGKPPPVDELKTWANELFLKGKVPGTGFMGMFQDKTTRIQSELGNGAFDPEFSKDDEQKARAALQAAGARRIDEAAISSYLRRKHRLGSLPTQAGAAADTKPAGSRATPDTRLPGALRPGEAKF